MNEVAGKIRIAFLHAKKMQDYDRVISLAQQAIDQLHTITNFPEQSDYEVGFYSEKEWIPIKTGSRDFCIGYAQALDRGADYPEYYRVLSFGGLEIWPQWGRNFVEE